MDPELVKVVASNGVFAVLFVAYLVYRTKTDTAREERLMRFMETIAPLLTEIKSEQRAHNEILCRVESKIDRLAEERR